MKNTSSQQTVIDVQFAVTVEGMPDEASFRQWVLQALPPDRQDAELTIRIVDEAEMTALNREYRGKDAPTNVLSFPFEVMPGVETNLLGDIVICAPVVVAESVVQHQPLEAHWAHMVVHGVLHLLGYIHEHDDEAQHMEAREAGILTELGYSDPYA